MPGQTYEELYNFLKNTIAADRNRKQKLIDALDQYHEYTEGMRRKDRYGRVPYVTAEQKEKLMELHKAIANQAENILQARAGKQPGVIAEDAFFRGAVNEVAKKAAENLTMIAGYDPENEQKTLAALEEDSRVLTLDDPDSKKKHKGLSGAMNSRRVISYVDREGKTVIGLFTPKTELNAWKGFSDAVKNAAEGMEKGPAKDLLSGFMVNLMKSNQPQKEFLPDKMSEQDIPAEDRNAALIKICNSIAVPKESGSYEADLNQLALAIGQYAESGNPQLFAAIKAKMGNPEKISPKALAATVSNMIGTEKLQQISEAVQPYLAHVLHNIAEAQMPDNSRVDIRNAAASAVADLLGAPNILARSRPMILRGADGKEIEGVFMERAVGMDPQNLPRAAQFVDEEALKNTNGKALKSLADLQVLDFICGNVDRHFANMFYSLSGVPKLNDVQGIDTDCSFGLFVPKNGNSRKHLPGTDNMRCVSESMFKRVMALDGATLKYALRGYGLTEPELNAAVERLTHLQNALQKGVEHYKEADKDQERWKNRPDVHGDNLSQKSKAAYFFDKKFIRVVPDQDFYRVRMDDLKLCVNEKGEEIEWDAMGVAGNTFDQAYREVATMQKDYLDQQGKYTELSSRATKVGQNNRCLKQNLKSGAEAFESYVDKLEKRTKFAHSSGNYRDMQRAAKALVKFQRSLQTRVEHASDPERKHRPGYKDDLAAIVRPSDLEKLKQLSEKLEKASHKYLVGKGILPAKGEQDPKKTLEDYKEYTQNRINVAKELLSFAKASKVIKPEEKEMAEVNERRAQEDLSRRLGDAAEEKYLDKHPEEKEARLQQRLQEAQKKVGVSFNFN